jgi:hypothetical protein
MTNHRTSAERLLESVDPALKRRTVPTLLAAIVHAVLAVETAIRDEWVPVEPKEGP